MITMAVDEKYIETVKDTDDFDDVLAEFGIEASFEQNDNGVDLTGYTSTMLRDMYYLKFTKPNLLIKILVKPPLIGKLI